jgi:hypothetical protein
MRNVKIFVDYWNFQLRWHEAMKAISPTGPQMSLPWERLPQRLMGELPKIFGTTDPLTFRGIQVFASVNPNPGSRDEGLKKYLHFLNQQPGFQIQIRDRKSKTDECPHCSKKIERMVEKGVDASIVTALYEGAINNSYDIGLLLSNDTDHIPAISTIQERLNKQIVHVGFKKGGSEVRTSTWGHILMDGPVADQLATPRT